jgi:thiol-disulfide isomerase/thioredoxin
MTVLAAALAACGEELRSDAGAPDAQANRLLSGGRDAFEARLADLRGTPVVVNQWASWCPPCRGEFPIFQRMAKKYAGRVAFLGVDMKDDREVAREFMRELPTPYPHYFDDDASISRLFGGGRVSPTTGFYDARGKLTFTHLGPYADDAQLEAEIRRYALG